MNVQMIIVGIIVSLAFLSAGNMIWQKVKSLNSKSACAGDCGCGTKTSEKSFVQIGKS